MLLSVLFLILRIVLFRTISNVFFFRSWVNGCSTFENSGSQRLRSLTLCDMSNSLMTANLSGSLWMPCSLSTGQRYFSSFLKVRTSRGWWWGKPLVDGGKPLSSFANIFQRYDRSQSYPLSTRSQKVPSLNLWLDLGFIALSHGFNVFQRIWLATEKAYGPLQ